MDATAAAIKAHYLGYRIIAAIWNETLATAGATVRISADPPPPGTSLDDARNALRNALVPLRPLLPELPPDEKLRPWTLGYIHPAAPGKTLLYVPLVGHAAIKHDVQRAIQRLQDNWTAGDWRTYVAEAVERYQRWEWLDRIEVLGKQTRDSSPSPAAAACRAVDRDDHQSRRLVAERWERFKAEYRELGYRRASHENFAAWVEETFDDMPSTDADELRRMVKAYKRTPEPKRLS